MRFILNINQPKAIEWELTLPQAILFDYLLSEASSPESLKASNFCTVTSKYKILAELPLITDKPDTLKRHLKALEDAGIILRSVRNNQLIIYITTKGTEWKVQTAGINNEGAKQ